MSAIDKLYRIDNYKIQKTPELETELYNRLKKLENKYDTGISQLVNICIEDFLNSEEEIYYYRKPEGEVTEYRSILIRIQNYKELEKIKEKTGISITRLINLSIKRFLDKYNKSGI